MALNDSYMYPASDLTLEKVVRDRNSRTSQALREIIGETEDGGAGNVSTQQPGKELHLARRLSQFTWTGGGAWTNVEGLSMYLDTMDGPVELRTDLGLCVVNGTLDASIYWRILDFSRQLLVPGAAGSMPLLAGLPGGFNSTTFPPLFGRLPAGLERSEYVVQVQITTNNPSAYIVPDWYPGAVATFSAKGI